MPEGSRYDGYHCISPFLGINCRWYHQHFQWHCGCAGLCSGHVFVPYHQYILVLLWCHLFLHKLPKCFDYTCLLPLAIVHFTNVADSVVLVVSCFLTPTSFYALSYANLSHCYICMWFCCDVLLMFVLPITPVVSLLLPPLTLMFSWLSTPVMLVSISICCISCSAWSFCLPLL